MNEELKKKILDDIKLTGFPSELEVAEKLKYQKWYIEQNSTYLDFEANKSREIDIKARKIYSHKDEKCHFFIAINLIIEVKKATKRPWIIFTIPYVKQSYSKFLGPAFGQLHYSMNFSIKNLSAEKFMKNFPRNNCKTIGTSFYEAFKSTEEPSKIYEAIMSAIKAAFYARRLETGEDFLSKKKLEKQKNEIFKPELMQRIEVYIPVVIMDGILCEATLKNDGEIEIMENDYLPLTLSHSIRPYLDNFDYYPELIHIRYLDSFLEKFDRWGKSVISEWKKY